MQRPGRASSIPCTAGSARPWPLCGRWPPCAIPMHTTWPAQPPAPPTGGARGGRAPRCAIRPCQQCIACPSAGSIYAARRCRAGSSPGVRWWRLGPCGAAGVWQRSLAALGQCIRATADGLALCPPRRTPCVTPPADTSSVATSSTSGRPAGSQSRPTPRRLRQENCSARTPTHVQLGAMPYAPHATQQSGLPAHIQAPLGLGLGCRPARAPARRISCSPCRLISAPCRRSSGSSHSLSIRLRDGDRER